MRNVRSKRGEAAAARQVVAMIGGDALFDMLSQRDPDHAAFVSDWIAKQPDPKPSFGEAFLRLVEIGDMPKSKRPAL